MLRFHFHLQDMLLQVRKFLKGLAHDSRSTNHELIKSSVMLLKTLPATRFAVLEYFSSVYDDAVYNLLSSNEGIDIQCMEKFPSGKVPTKEVPTRKVPTPQWQRWKSSRLYFFQKKKKK